MNHYYRITAYHKTSNVCLIADSNGKFEKLWQFSSFFVCKGFEIVSSCQRRKFIVRQYSESERRFAPHFNSAPAEKATPPFRTTKLP